MIPSVVLAMVLAVGFGDRLATMHQPGLERFLCFPPPTAHLLIPGGVVRAQTEAPPRQHHCVWVTGVRRVTHSTNFGGESLSLAVAGSVEVLVVPPRALRDSEAAGAELPFRRSQRFSGGPRSKTDEARNKSRTLSLAVDQRRLPGGRQRRGAPQRGGRGRGRVHSPKDLRAGFGGEAHRAGTIKCTERGAAGLTLQLLSHCRGDFYFLS